MNLDTFGHSPAGRVVTLGEGPDAYPAFVPNPLPPTVEVDLALLVLHGEAMLEAGRLDGLARDLPNPRLLVKPLLRNEAVVSSRIEGTRAELVDLWAYEAGRRKPLPGRENISQEDVREVHNYVLALEFALDRDPALPLDLGFLRELHRILMTDVRGGDVTPGEFRGVQVWVGPPGSDRWTATYVPPPPGELPAVLADFERYLNATNDYPPLLRLAFLHYQFEALHPFRDGNGRIGRLLLGLLVVRWGLVSQPLLYLSEYFERYRRDYYDLLNAVSETGAWREWVEFFLRGVKAQAASAARKTRALLDLQVEWKKLLTTERASTLTLRLAESLLIEPTITARHAQQVLGVGSFHTAQKHIDRLVALGVLEPAGGDSYDRAYETIAIRSLLAEIEDAIE